EFAKYLCSLEFAPVQSLHFWEGKYCCSGQHITDSGAKMQLVIIVLDAEGSPQDHIPFSRTYFLFSRPLFKAMAPGLQFLISFSSPYMCVLINLRI
ncbi:MAG: hypothetical protein ACK559_05315, partial [bacterium]